MIYIYELTAAQQAVMDAKAVVMKQPFSELIDQKVAEFIDACSRDVGLDVDTRLAKALAGKDAAEKEALIVQLDTIPEVAK